jgi:ABC-type nitrate/sulfonate/bicarbonate transport system substrate-binding protein
VNVEYRFSRVRYAIVGLVALCTVLVSACGRRAPDRDVVSLRLGVQDNVICALPFIAAQQGYFRDHGVDVVIRRYPSGKLALNAMFDGEVDVAAVADMPVMANSFRRDDYAIFGTIASTDSGAWLVARKDQGISKPADLKGKRVATQRNSAVHFFLSMFLLKNRLAETDVDLRFMPAAELPAALADGRIDAFSMRNPFMNEAKALLGETALEMFDRDVYRQTFNLVTWKRLLKEDPDIWQRVLLAIADAEDLLVRDETAGRAALVSYLGGDREAEILGDWHKYTFVLSLDQSLFVTLEAQAEWAATRNPDLGAELPNYWHFIDTGPLRAVKPQAVSIIQ